MTGPHNWGHDKPRNKPCMKEGQGRPPGRALYREAPDTCLDSSSDRRDTAGKEPAAPIARRLKVEPDGRKEEAREWEKVRVGEAQSLSMLPRLGERSVIFSKH
ncbi:unnamed protein product [Lota lota]